MRKILAVMAAMVMILSMGLIVYADVVEVSPNKNYTATKTTEAITLDGLKDAAYDTAETVQFDVKDEAVAGCSGEMQLVYDGSYLYAFISIADPTYSKAYDEKAWWNNVDSIWVGFNDTDCWAFSRDNETECNQMGPTAVSFKVQNMNGSTPVSVADARGGATVTGYNLEVKIPCTLDEGATLLFGSFAAIDNEAGDAGLVEGRIRTSGAVSNMTSDNGIWNAGAGMWDGWTDQNGEALGSSSFFDKVTFVAAPEVPTETPTEAPTEEPTDTPATGDTGVMPYALLMMLGAGAFVTVLLIKKRA